MDFLISSIVAVKHVMRKKHARNTHITNQRYKINNTIFNMIGSSTVTYDNY